MTLFGFWTDYWVSNARKFCDFCKCSIADNKPSIQFHENGKKHKENVRLRLAEMQKKSTKEASAAAVVEKQMKKMEEEAMKAYLKDIQENPDFTSQMIKEKVGSASSQPIKTEPKDVLPSKRVDKPAPKKDTKRESTKQKAAPGKKWLEAKSDEGHSYYWHMESGESSWEPPPEGYLSIEEQEAPAAPKPNNPTPVIKKEPVELSVSDANEKIYRGASEVKTEPSDETPSPVIGPQPRIDPYGGWTTVVKKEPKNIDFQLPQVTAAAAPAQVYVPEKKPKMFKEKIAPVSTVASTTMTEEVAFKKRKFGGARNARQRTDDD